MERLSPVDGQIESQRRGLRKEILVTATAGMLD